MGIEVGQRIGRYEVVRKLGHGGFGVLYVGRDLELDREVALKFLRSEHLTRPHVVQRFLKEARAAAKINHGGIVTVFECGEVTGTNTPVDGTVYIAMELLQGESLGALLTREGRLAPPFAIGLCRQITAALGAAHKSGIVHRDLKPDNIFLVPDAAVRGGQRVKILDFGIAKLAEDQLSGGMHTHSAVVLGTPSYMSPEQCKSSTNIDHRSDIYATGCILFQLLTGRTPYQGNAGELIANHQLAPVPAPRELLPDLPLDLDRLLTQMLAKAPDARPASMEVVDEALASCEDSAPHEISSTMTTLMRDVTGTTTLREGAGETTTSAVKSSPWKTLVGVAVMTIAGTVAAVVALSTAGSEPPPEAQPASSTSPRASDVVPPDDLAPTEPLTVRTLEERKKRLEEAHGPVAKGTESTPVAGPPCDADALLRRGDDLLAAGMDAAALAAFEESMSCQPDTALYRKALRAACGSKNAAKAKHYYGKLPANTLGSLAQLCRSNGIDPSR